MINTADRKLLGLLQAEFPLTPEPYADLGLKLGISANEVIQRIQELKADHIVRQIGPVMDARRLGYHSTLAAMKVAGENLAGAERLILEHPGVSHGYERDHEFNIWITLSVPGRTDVDTELKKLATGIGALAAISLPALKVFKLRAIFSDGEDSEGGNGNGSLKGKARLSAQDRLVINGLQQDLPLSPRPFAGLADKMGLSEAALLEVAGSLVDSGVIRRYGAAVNHRKAGYEANGMACWVAGNDKLENAAAKLTSFKEVSHCYERRTGPLWRYNLFAMIHGHAPADCEKIVREVSRETGLSDSLILFSTREIKKVRIKYLV